MGGFAWVTLATNDSYSLGALVLANSLKQVGTLHQLAVLVTPGVTNAMREKLRQVFDVVQEVNVLDSKDEANLRLLKRPELGITFTKLHCWRLTQFDKCVFLDADTLVLENCDELFEREELSAAPDVGWPDCFNSGVFVYRPSNETYDKLIQFALEKGSFDGGDQGLLNLFFSDWAHKDISKHLPFIYNMCSTACYSYLPAYKQFGANAKIIHFIGATKPWLQYFDTETRRVHPSGEAQHLQVILQHWWNIFCTLIHPNLTPDMTQSHTDTVHGSPPYVPPRTIPPIHYDTYQHFPAPDIPSPAEDYQNVWDPWEEYDFRQSNVPEIIHFTPSYSQSSQQEIPESYSYPHNQHHENHSQPLHHQHHEIHSQSDQHFESHNEPSYNRDCENQSQHSHNQYHVTPDQPTEIYVEPTHTFNIQHETYSHHVENNQQSQLVESHNTKANLAGHHDSRDHQRNDDGHYYHPPRPTFSLPVIEPVPQQFTHHEPPPPEKMTNEPHRLPTIDSCPRLPDECVATTTVSNDITLNTGTIEDASDNSSGLAGAFAQLTLGTPRTAEQTALDDHLRRQGWEVGNIDYLGKDSFDNIWSKICETLSSAPEPTPKPKDPSPPATSEVTVPELSPVEVISKPESTVADIPASTTEPVVEAATSVPVPETPAEDTPKPAEVALQPSAPAETAPDVSQSAPTPNVVVPPSPEILESSQPTISNEPASVVPESTQPLPVDPETPKPDPAVPEISQPIPTVLEGSQPVSEIPQPAPVVSEIPLPGPDVSDAPQPAAVITEMSQPAPTVSETPQPAPAISETPQPAPVVLETPQPAPAVSETPQPAPADSETPQLVPAVSEIPQPAPKESEILQPSPEISEPVPAVVETTDSVPTVTKTGEPAATIVETLQPSPIISETVQPVPIASETVQPPPESPTPVPTVTESSSQVLPQPASVVPESLLPSPVVTESTKPTLEAPKSSEPIPNVPKSPEPVLVPEPAPVSAEIPASPQSAPVVPVSPTSTPSGKPAKKPKVVPETQPSVESPKPESSPLVCPIAPKSGEKKTGVKKVPKEASQSAKPEAGEPTPPSASSEASAATPTPPPRKVSGAPKKTSTKPKK